MKKQSKIFILLIVILTISSNVFAHGGNISGWNDRQSNKIVENNGKYYGYHNEDGIRHYHEVEWNEQEGKWEIVDSKTYYNKNLKVTTIEEISQNDGETEKIEVKYSQSTDGDTAKFEMDGEIITVRFLAVDTPESVHPTKEVQAYGVEASNFTKEKLQNAQKIELEFDNNSDKTDKYNRYLAWVWVDGELLQDLLIKEGLAKVAYLYADYKYTEQLQASEEIAKNSNIKIWQDNIEEIYTVQNNEENQTNSVGNTIQENNEQDIPKEIIIIFAILTILTSVIKVLKKPAKRKKLH